MTLCRCGKAAGGRSGLCDNCYAMHRRRQIAYGRWQPDRIDPTPAREHLAALRGAGMGLRRIEKLSGLSRPTLQHLSRAGFVSRNTQDRLLSVPIPGTVFDPVLAAGTQISGIGSMRRLRALTRMGWSAQVIADRIGVHRHQVTSWTSGRTQKITAAHAATVAELFDRIQMTAGPSRKAARWAELRGWAPPMAWDEDTIDDPAAQPFGATRRTARVPLHAQIDDLLDVGVPADPDRLAQLLNTTVEHVERTLYRMQEAS